MNEWQPIETASYTEYGLFYLVPDIDGEGFLVTESGHKHDRRFMIGASQIVLGKNHTAWSQQWKATHWMPLPKPPSAV